MKSLPGPFRTTLIFVVIVLVVGILPGCQTASSPTGKRPAVAVDLAPNLDSFKVEKVAVLGFVNTTGQDRANLMERYVDAALAQSAPYQIVKQSSFMRDAERHQMSADFGRTLEVWQKVRALTRADVEGLLDAAGCDAMLGWEVTHWKEEKIDSYQEGTSKTTVGLKMVLYAKDGTLLWSGSGLKTAESLPYNPELHTRSTVSGEAVQDKGAVPEPPKIEPVAQQLAEEVVATMPKIPPPAAPAP